MGKTPRRLVALGLLLGFLPLADPGWLEPARAQSAGPEVLQALPSRGAPGAQIVDLATRSQVRVRILLLPEGQPQASLLLFVGGDGRLNLDQDTDLSPERGNFLKRSAPLFAKQGFTVALMDVAEDKGSLFGPPSRTSAEHAQDVAGVIAYLRQRAAVPVWLVGTSRGTVSAANAASRLGAQGAEGLVLSSTVMSGRQAGVFAVSLEGIRQPVLVVHHQHDGCQHCPFAEVPRLLAAFKSAPVVELMSFSQGKLPISDPCEALSYHGYYGIEAEVAQAMGQWIKARTLVRP